MSICLPATLVAITIALATIAIALFVSHHCCCYHHHPLHCHCCRHCRCLPTTLVTITIALLPSPSLSLAHPHHHCPHHCLPQLSLPPLPFLLLAHHLHHCCHCSCHCCNCHHNCLPPLLSLQLPSLLPLISLPATLVAVTPPLGGGGKDHTNLVRDPTLAAAASAIIIIATFAARATSREGLAQQHTGIQRPADGVRQHGRAAVGICVAGVILHANQRQQWQWRADGCGCGVGSAATKSTKTMTTT